MDTTVERWAPVVDWPKYEISDLGRVRSARGMIRTFPVQGYPSFNVVDREKRKSLRVHREVLRAHVGLRPGLVARHLDGNPTNCALSNLAWGTHKDNEADKASHHRSLRGERHHHAKLTGKQVEAIKAAAQHGTVLAKFFGVSPSQISAIRRGRSWRNAA